MVIRRVSDYLGTPLPAYPPNQPASPASPTSSDPVAPPSAGSSAAASTPAPIAPTASAPEPAARPSSPETSHNLEPSPSQAQTRLERAELQYAQAKARLQALKNRAATQARKLDTRRKVVLGGALMDLASRDDAAAAMLDRLVRNLPREQDRKAFDGWTPGDALPEDTIGPTSAASASGSKPTRQRP